MSEGHDHSHLSDTELRVRALESLLTEKGLVDPDALDAIVDRYENKVGPRNGAKVVARAWMDPEFKKYLLEDGTAAIGSLGYLGSQGADMVVLENTEKVHNVTVCTLCSCYPWPVLGLPPAWFKSFPYRARLVKEPRAVLQEFGLKLDDDIEVRVWDSTAELRYLVLPERPSGTDSMSEEELADIVTRNSMIGTEKIASPKGGA